ncbi:zinc finger protein 90-like [Toxorhynchites rutilus septentrionalis]|uniref:zinc finger protein 90-like n=1 Tax=Toxorhynchites rutilus septentrionalis TaxID=329112 RepID=UPI002479DFEA|nr:zinc finger protein 90-like [Toxorhynchites rutilus septentrionalis]
MSLNATTSETFEKTINEILDSFEFTPIEPCTQGYEDNYNLNIDVVSNNALSNETSSGISGELNQETNRSLVVLETATSTSWTQERKDYYTDNPNYNVVPNTALSGGTTPGFLKEFSQQSNRFLPIIETAKSTSCKDCGANNPSYNIVPNATPPSETASEAYHKLVQNILSDDVPRSYDSNLNFVPNTALPSGQSLITSPVMNPSVIEIHPAATISSAPMQITCNDEKTIVDSPKSELQCMLCGMVCSSKSGYKLHTKNIHGTPRPYRCNTCGKNFEHQARLEEHQKTHLAENKKFGCELCEKRYAHKKDLDTHYQKHSKLRFQCNIGSCGQGFARADHLRAHQKAHINRGGGRVQRGRVPKRIKQDESNVSSYNSLQ